MPILTTSVKRLPFAAAIEPERMPSANLPISASTRLTSAITSLPSTRIGAARAVAQSDMQHGAVLGGVDRLAGKHAIALARHPGCAPRAHAAAPSSLRRTAHFDQSSRRSSSRAEIAREARLIIAEGLAHVAQAVLVPMRAKRGKSLFDCRHGTNPRVHAPRADRRPDVTP